MPRRARRGIRFPCPVVGGISRELGSRAAVRVGGSNQNERVTRRGLILFAALGIAWGIPYLFIKVAVSELDPAMVVLSRSALAAILLLPLAFFRREVVQVVRRWKPMLAYTIVEIILPWYFLSSAEQRLPSSTAGLLLATVPLAGVAIAFAMGRPERLSRLNWLGITLGMLGVAALVGLDIAGSDLIAVAEMAVVVVGYALGPAILARWMSDLPGVGVVAVSLAATAVVYVPFVLLTDAWPAAWPSTAVIVSIIVLAVVCSALAFLLMVGLVAEIGPVKATAITYVNPAVAIIAGVVVLGERVTVWTIVGFVLVLAGSYLVTRRRRDLVAAEGPEEATAEQCESPSEPSEEERARRAAADSP
ncbi:drug/metabolite transporter (DMT)-like permease [Agromyces ramosus]|jgi:drug/metabolite transporter (DMT)-like permease|uniref:Drug/metabolite transporter (DMT)-like permease n=1 Tax=Agromyces ramosus TaxID=33879 RepID=A0A4Q7MA57_9MICO|nr:drug/metabolite transporter (DMT)-like permease [Agromyces ramosus]